MAKVAGLFSGIGGLEKSFVEQGFELAFVAEVDKHASSVLRWHHPLVPNLGDVKLLKGADLPEVDVLTFGSPCQDVSRARTTQTDGFHDLRSGLVWQVVRLIAELRRANCLPQVLVWENVGAIIEPKWRSQYVSIVKAFESHGYAFRAFVEEARDAGVPQIRPRVVTVFSRLGCNFPATAGRRGGQPKSLSDCILYGAGESLAEADRARLLGQLYRQRLGAVKRERRTRVEQVETFLGMRPGEEPATWNVSCVSYSPTYTCTPQVECISTLTRQDSPWVRFPDGTYRQLTADELELCFGLPTGYTKVGAGPDRMPWELTEGVRRGLLGNAVVPAAVESVAHWAAMSIGVERVTIEENSK
ncbi:MAG: DNA cytosine methyltransferase [Armatimonadetes bacterium]|nr:DNA cytosine methyltransferase [Armatimonadota bacterium]